MHLGLRADTVPVMTTPDTTTNAASILAISGFFCGFTTVVVAARIFVRASMLKTVGANDMIITAATICGAGVFACFVGETKHGMGMHTLSIPPAEFTKIFHWNYFHSIIVTVGISLVKISVACFLLRLAPKKGYRYFLYATIVFLTAFTFSSAGTIAFSRIPIRASWDRFGEPNAKCFSNSTFTAIGLFNSTVNIVTDVLFASLPIPVIWNLQVNIRTKVSLVAILSLGYFACAASLVKTVLQSKVLEDPDFTFNDSYAIWNSIELYVGLLAASFPSLRPLFRSLLETTRDIRTRVTGSGPSRHLGTKHKYYIQEEGIGMNSLGPKGSQGGLSGKYNVRATTRSQLEWGRSESEFDEISKRDNESSEDILPI